MLSLKNIVKYYPAGDSFVQALKGVSVDFREHEFVSILGPSGCGKTTLLNIIGGLDGYTSGDLVIGGRSTKTFKSGDWDTYRNHSIGFVFQSYNLIPHQSVLANVELALTLSGVSKGERRKRAKEALVQVGLGDQINKRPNQLSGGQMQRVAIARALVNDPDILLADEPTGALDTATSVQIMDVLKEISKDRLIIMVTHNPELAEQYSSRIIRLLDGNIVADSNPYTPTEDDKPVTEKYKNKRSMSFFTAFSLSITNLMTKKARTFLTSFAGSIGIIGIALILALSNGIQTYIDTVQEDTLSSYPIQIEAEQADMSSLLSAFTSSSSNTEPHELDAVYENQVFYKLINSMMSVEVNRNNLTDFKTYLDKSLAPGSDSRLADAISTVQYGYNVSINAYVKDNTGKFAKADMLGLFATMAGNSGLVTSDYLSLLNSMSSSSMGMNIWDEILPGRNGEVISDLIYEQYDLIYGAWPKNADEVVLILDDHNEVTDVVLYSLGLISSQEMIDAMTKVMLGEEVEPINASWSYEEITNISFKLLLDTDYYADTDGNGIWENISGDESRMNLLLNNAPDVKIVGIIRPNPDATATAMSGYIGYTTLLTEKLIKGIGESAVIRAQQDSDKNILTGLPFELKDDQAPDNAGLAAEMRNHFADLSPEDKIEIYKKILSDIPAAVLNEQVEGTMAMFPTRADKEKLIAEQAPDALALIAGLTDEQLDQMLRESISAMIVETHAAQMENEVNEQLMTPTEEQIASLAASLQALYPTRDAKIGAIAQSWDESTGMGLEKAYVQLSACTDEELDAYLTRLVADSIGEAFAAYCNGDTSNIMVMMYGTVFEGWLQENTVRVASMLDAWAASKDDDSLAADYDKYMPARVSNESKADVLKRLGLVDLASPNRINIYAATFADKDVIADVIANEYNKSVPEEDQITYTDLVKILMSSITTIINVISYVLIAFVAISLLVSSIMIGIITYISVLERTKEIGILRAVGASKRDIARVFNAETLAIGFISGIIGIGATLILILPINAIIRFLSGFSNIGAILPWQGAIILVIISMTLTLIAGLIPSSIAAKKDPVVALRSE